MDEFEFYVQSDGTPRGTRVFVDGKPLKGIKSVWFEADVNDGPSLNIEVMVVKAEFIDREPVMHGLEEVDTALLVAELKQRGDLDQILKLVTPGTMTP
jgi:hypothetical protein